MHVHLKVSIGYGYSRTFNGRVRSGAIAYRIKARTLTHTHVDR